MRILFLHRGRVARAFALCLLALAATLAQSREARAQWSQPDAGGNVTSTNAGGVGIGGAPVKGSKLEVRADHGVAAGEHGLIYASRSGVGTGGVFFGYRANGTAATGGYMRSISNLPLFVGTTATPEAMVISDNGNVGIGTAAPAAVLDGQRAETSDLLMRLWNTSSTAGTATFRIANSSNAGSRLQFTDSNSYVSTVAADRALGLRFRTGNASSEGALADRMTISPGGNVGIGTAAPVGRLDVRQLGNLGQLATFLSSYGASEDTFIRGGSASATVHIGDLTATTSKLLLMENGGNVGIGTTAPASKLHVAGNITVDGNINAKYQDVAEWVPSTQKLAAGTVVILDAERNNHVLASKGSYDTSVAGVISAQPGLSLGEKGEGKVLVATTGRVKVRVDATRAPIRIGDLIVTSEVEGVAMKSEPVSVGGVAIHRPGTLIGKALESLEKGTGEILVLLSLQ